jgi:zona occludens toxin
MIDLNTGIPGSGKTLSMTQTLAALFERWGTHPEEARPVFVLGIPELSLPHAPLPLKSVQVAKAGAPMLVPDWDEMPDGSLVIIDEAQGCFPPRSSASTAPAHVAWLNTHRHRGFDIWLTTQHPKLIDGTVRALVGRHKHFRRMFGMQRSVIYEWDACSDSLSGMNNAVKTYWSFPRKAFKWYKSAEIHTKQKFKLPLWLAIFPIGVLMAVIFFPKAYSVLANGIAGKGLSSSESVPPEAVQGGALAPTQTGSQMVGYVLQGTKCYGFTKSGAYVDEPEKCRENTN